MEDLFQHIADIISISNFREWNNAVLTIAVLGGSVNYQLKFEYADGTSKGEFFRDDKALLARQIRQVHQDMNQQHPNHWNKLVFRIQSDGKFSNDFEWDHEEQDRYEITL